MTLARQVNVAAFVSMCALSSALTFVVVFVPLLPLVVLRGQVFRRAVDVVFHIWQAFVATLVDVVLGTSVKVSGDTLRADERSLVVVNHRSRIDVAGLASALFHATNPLAGNVKLVLGAEHRCTPGFGWCLQLTRSAFLSGEWKQDSPRLSAAVSLLAADPAFQLVLFPEGAPINSESVAKSNAFAAANNLKPLQFVLHPRTTGFGYLVEKMRDGNCIDAIYDVTLAYEKDEVPYDEWQSLKSGHFPSEVQVLIKRYDVRTVPTTILGLERWLQELWRDKDQLLERYHREGQPLAAAPAINRPVMPLQILSLISWSLFMYWGLSSLLLSVCGFVWTAFVCATMTCLSRRSSGGVDDLVNATQTHGAAKAIAATLFHNKQE